MMTRRDRKYMVPTPDAVRFVLSLHDRARVLTIDGTRSFSYESVYFDTPAHDLYLDAARRRPRRYKVRTRTYLDTGAMLLEVKTRDPRGRTVKLRREHHAARGDTLDDESLAFLRECPSLRSDGRALGPVLTTNYLRATLVLGEGRRVTIDTDVRSTTPDGRTVRLVGMTVIETKSRGAPSEADRILWESGHRPIRLSKFCTSLAALEPELPSNTWTRALRYPWVVYDETRFDRRASGQGWARRLRRSG
jgi:hypothetical protein